MDDVVKALSILQEISAEASSHAKIPIARACEFTELLSAAVKQLDKIRVPSGINLAGVQTYRFRIPRRYLPRDSIEELAALADVVSDFDVAASRLGDRTIEWLDREAKKAGQQTLHDVRNVLDEFKATSERTLRLLSNIQSVTAEVEKHDRYPRPVEVAALMTYEAAVRSGGKLSTNKNSTDGGNPGSFRRYLEALQPLMPVEIRFKDLSAGALTRLKTRADRIISLPRFDPA